MKKILFVLTVFMMVGVAANAQACTKKASAKACAKTCTKKADAKMTKVAAQVTEADVAAESDASIQTRVCDKSGAKSYYQKSVCAKSGSVSWDEVSYCSKSKKFTKVAAASMEKDIETGAVKSAGTKKECSKKCSKKCTGKAKKASM